MHTKLSGVADYFANDDYDALNIIKSIMKNLNYKKKYDLNLKMPLTQNMTTRNLWNFTYGT